MEDFICLFLVAACLNFAWGQAPGDHEDTCRTGMNAALHDFPTEVKILMDTFDYTALYGSAGTPWTAVDGDGDGRNWDTVFGNPCTFGMNTCTQPQSQDNWLFSQFIGYVGAREVFFNVTYRFNRCRSPCTKRYADLYQHVRDSANAGARVQSSNYGQPFLRLEQPSGDEGSIDVTHAMPRPANRRGFYLGVRDEGTCGAVERIIVYYVACLGSVDGLVTYPETGVPVRGGSNVIFDAHCASNAHNTTTLQVMAFASSSSCSPVAPGGARCECDAGYLISADNLSCEACRAGTYRTLSDSSCQSCPPNTVTGAMAAPECNCTSGFFRTPQEGPETGCTEPPGVVTNLQVMTRTDTTITVSWTPPATRGRVDFSYEVHHSDPENLGGDFIRAPDGNLVDGNAEMFTVTGLVPFTSYIISVTTRNGVSDQDADGAISRIAELSSKTEEGIPGPPNAVQRLCTTVVWQSPSQPNGEITGYELRFSSNLANIVSQGADVTFLVTDEEHRAEGVSVQVRARNSVGASMWTSLALVCPLPCMMNLEVTNITISTITIGWTRPPLAGDITYSIALSNRDGDSTFQTVEDSITDTSPSLTYTFTQLSTFTSYTVKLTVASSTEGVDPDVCTVLGRTSEGAPGPPTNVQGRCTTVVWQPPSQPNGVVTGYELRFSDNIESRDADFTFFPASNEQQKMGASFEIRAITGGGKGNWMEFPNGCSKTPDECGDNPPFSNSNGVELAIVVVCTFAITLVVVIVVVVVIYLCVRKKNSSNSGKPNNAYSSEMKNSNW